MTCRLPQRLTRISQQNCHDFTYTPYAITADVKITLIVFIVCVILIIGCDVVNIGLVTATQLYI